MEGDTFSVTSLMMINQPSENVCLYHDEQNVCPTVEQTMCLNDPSLGVCEVQPQEGAQCVISGANCVHSWCEEPEWPEHMSSGAIFNQNKNLNQAEKWVVWLEIY